MGVDDAPDNLRLSGHPLSKQGHEIRLEPNRDKSERQKEIEHG